MFICTFLEQYCFHKVISLCSSSVLSPIVHQAIESELVLRGISRCLSHPVVNDILLDDYIWSLVTTLCLHFARG